MSRSGREIPKIQIPKEVNGFQLYFAGSVKEEIEDVLRAEGCHRLYSQLNEPTDINRWVKHMRAGECRGKLFIDSGAHTAFYTGVELDMMPYVSMMNQLDDCVDIIAQCDVVPKDGTYESAPEYNWNNYLEMRGMLVSPQKLLPIYHIGEADRWLYNMLDWRGPNGEQVEYIGIAPRHEDSWGARMRFIDKCFQIIAKSSNPKVQTHALGMTKLSVLEAYPFTSADSTSYLQTSSMGSILTPFGTIAIGDRVKHAKDHYCGLPIKVRKAIDELIEKFGFTTKEIQERYEPRMKFNIMYMQNWARNYKYTPNPLGKRRLV